MKSIVITGSTRGIGFGLARSFLDLGCRVFISGRTQTAVDKAVSKLSANHSQQLVKGTSCDVTQFIQVQHLWDTAKSTFKEIDIWINNAGISHNRADLWELSEETINSVLETNLTGTAYGCKVAINGMLDQGHGSVYNMEGLGSDGRKIDGLCLYGTSKYGVKYLTDALISETKNTPVIVGALRPGMVVTDLLTNENVSQAEDWERTKRIFNILADRVENVTPWLAQKILANQKNGVRLSYMKPWKVIYRFITSPFSKRDVFSEN